jgi:PKD repeat protein
LADLNATAGKNDMTSFEFSRSGCAWCHPGGGGLEYDREGYRYDGVAGLFSAGANTAPKNGDYFIFGIDASSAADASAYAGAGFFEVPAVQTKGIMTPASAFNLGTAKMALDPGTGTYKQVAKKNVPVSTGGVAEADCLMCHYANQYSQIDRNWAAPGYQQPKWSASLGLVGALGQAGLITPGTKSGCTTTSPCTVGTNPALGTPSWNIVELTPAMIVKAPKNEGCSACHFFDNAFTTLGPAGKPMGNTAWQKYYAVGAYPDGDIGPSHGSYNGGNNITAWQVAKGKPEGGKRAESINDNNNPDAHMKWPAYGGTGTRMTCSICHYNLSGTFQALMQGAEVMYPEITVEKMDHQFAKGDNLPDGKNMDQLDNTVTCASCHIDGTHPNRGTAPIPAHAGFPAVHFQKLDCRVCHIPVLNAKSIWKVADFTVGPYRTFERNQAPEYPLGANAKPLLIWRQSSTSDTIKMEPVNTTVVPVWTDNSILKPTFQRVAKGAAEAKRGTDGFNASNIANFALNQAQGGDTTLIVNTQAEITEMVTRINAGAGISTAVMNFYINTFDVSHNVMPKGGKCIDRNADGDTLDAGECNYILGSTEGGGCVMCHSSSLSSGPTASYYSPKSVGFFDRTHTLFSNPTEIDSACGGTAGVHQTTIGGVKRVAVKLSTIKSDGTANTIDLSDVEDCAPVGNTLNQGAVLGYTPAQLATLIGMPTTPVQAPTVMGLPTARFSYMINGQAVTFTSQSINAASISWDFGDGSPTSSATPVTHTYTTGGAKTVSLLATNSTGSTNTKIVTITLAAVNTPPTAAGSITNVTADNIVTLTNTSHDDENNLYVTGGKVYINWGDGGLKTGLVSGGTYTHKFTNGVYKITLTAVDSRGAMNSITIPFVTSTASQGTISGFVTSGTTSINDALISLVSNTTGNVLQQVYSGPTPTGSYTLKNVAAGTYTVKASKYGYVFAPATVSVTLGSTTTLNITDSAAIALFKITGYIESGVNSSVTPNVPALTPPGILIQLLDSVTSATLKQTMTDGNGKFFFANLAFGNYTVHPVDPSSGTVTGSDKAISNLLADTTISRSTWTYDIP